ncbi:hypothetical protein M3N64_07380 [Sporolactobacillus sp. CPB3-1]|uniref:Uncharacterized protein n=1 Tax=Sporolactobacillus mangiferae TaxID=2940498 RepID=A0ABT0MA65_9BACL|nr:hypothetical protein [Sporolactobacillus mangiferae]MCL1631769.1 hypothetical protein [Sporolactobacillus mangiferae]
MSNASIYSQCCRLLNQPVEIRCHNGSVHRGVLTHVDDRYAYVQPQSSGLSGNPGLFLWRDYGWGYPVALASIAVILALGLFW